MINLRSIATLGIGFSPISISTIGLYNSIVEIIESSKKPLFGDQSFLYPTGYRLGVLIDDFLTFECQSIVLPKIESNYVDINTPLLDYSSIGTKLTTNTVLCSIMVLEDSDEYIKLIEWMNSYTNNASLSDYNIPSMLLNKFNNTTTISLDILNNNNNELIRLEFNDAFPLSINHDPMSTNNDKIGYIHSNIEFAFSNITIKNNA
jgi:hypothetical protein